MTQGDVNGIPEGVEPKMGDRKPCGACTGTLEYDGHGEWFHVESVAELEARDDPLTADEVAERYDPRDG